MLLSLRASQLLVDLFQRFSLHDDPLKEVGKIFKAMDVYQNPMKNKIQLLTRQKLPHLFLLDHSLVLFLQFLHLEGQIICPPRLLCHLLV